VRRKLPSVIVDVGVGIFGGEWVVCLWNYWVLCCVLSGELMGWRGDNWGFMLVNWVYVGCVMGVVCWG
jgi:hypothetical protein